MKPEEYPEIGSRTFAQRSLRLRWEFIFGGLALLFFFLVGSGTADPRLFAFQLFSITFGNIYFLLMRKAVYPYHDQQTCSDTRAAAMLFLHGVTMYVFTTAI